MYAGTSVKGVPELASRFRKPADDVSVLNRAAVEDRVMTEPIPVDALGDHRLVQRVNTWPKENRPFWLINAEQIERHRNTRPGIDWNMSNMSSYNSDEFAVWLFGLLQNTVNNNFSLRKIFSCSLVHKSTATIEGTVTNISHCFLKSGGEALWCNYCVARRNYRKAIREEKQASYTDLTLNSDNMTKQYGK
nr:unnamed protein product [Callosobruchus analis]